MEEIHIRQKPHVPVWQKSCLAVKKAAAYSGIGITNLKQLSNDDRCRFVLWVKKTALQKRKT